MIAEVGKFKISRVGPVALKDARKADLEKSVLQFQSRGSSWQNFLVFSGGQSFSIKAFDCLDEGNLLYSKSTDFNVHLT